MTKVPKPVFRFVTALGQNLTDRIIEIEALATKQIAGGTASHSVSVGAKAMLMLACEDLKLV